MSYPFDDITNDMKSSKHTTFTFYNDLQFLVSCSIDINPFSFTETVIICILDKKRSNCRTITFSIPKYTTGSITEYIKQVCAIFHNNTKELDFWKSKNFIIKKPDILLYILIFALYELVNHEQP